MTRIDSQMAERRDSLPRLSTPQIVFGAVALITAGALFLVFGVLFTRHGGWFPFGVGFAGLGSLATGWGLVHIFRGKRITAGVVGDRVVVRDHLSERSVKLADIQQVHRMSESISLLTTQGWFVIEDMYFPDEAAQKALFAELEKVIASRDTGESSEQTGSP